MRLEPLCDLELEYQKTLPGGGHFVLVRPYGTEEGRGYGEGTATFTGVRLNGEARWVNHPRRRSDCVMQPELYGTIRTTDGADVLFSLTGRTVFDGEQGRQVLTALFETEHDSYRWLNDTVCVVEGNINSGSGRMHAKVFACVHGMTPADGQEAAGKKAPT